MKKGDDVAREPTYSDDDEYCSVCGDDNVVIVINSGVNCHYCGNQVNLCSWCHGMLKKNIKDIGM